MNLTAQNRALSEAKIAQALNNCIFLAHQLILCKPSDLTIIDKFPDSVTDLGYVIKTTGHAVSSTAQVPRNPLRQIVSRTPVSETVWSGTHDTHFYLDTLSCGHQTFVYPQTGEVAKARHRCAVCGNSQLAIKFPPSPVLSTKKRKTA
jgi:hypothetical protein